MRIAAILAAMAALAGCGSGGEGTEIVVQRFFGECGAVYGQTVDVSAAEGECGILTTLINKFEAENPDIRLKINVVAWPGYPQLSAQIAAGDPPDAAGFPDGAPRSLVDSEVGRAARRYPGA